MNRRAVAALLAVSLGLLLVNSYDAYLERKQDKAILEDRDYTPASSEGRFVDMGVLLLVVEIDPNGAELIPSAPKMRIIREHRLGGMVDTKAKPKKLVGPSENPVVWYCSADQEQILLHNDFTKPAQLVYGSEGAGKTRVLAMWHAIQVLRHLGEKREGGQTAPTLARLESLLNEMRALYPSRWYKYRSSRRILRFCDGTGIRLVSTHRRSSSAGSPLQSYNWSWLGDDEIQDSVAEVDNGTARLRTAKGGAKRAPRLGTATAKDATEWRNCRDKLETSGLWIRRTLLGTRSPFIHPDHWEAMKASMSAREYQRRVLAMDVGPERMTYPSWSHDLNLRPDPRGKRGWLDVTARELAAWGPNHQILIGHDPGQLCDVSLFLKAFINPTQGNPNPPPIWFVVDELTTYETTTELHVVALKKRLREHWACYEVGYDGKLQQGTSTALVSADPSGNSENDADHPDRTVYTVFRQHGIQIKAAAYTASDNLKKSRVGRVPREAGIDLINTLFCAANENRRLFVACDERRQPVAKQLVTAIERSERDEAGRAESGPKDKNDPSHWPAALRYALWAIEKPRMSRAA